MLDVLRLLKFLLLPLTLKSMVPNEPGGSDEETIPVDATQVIKSAFEQDAQPRSAAEDEDLLAALADIGIGASSVAGQTDEHIPDVGEILGGQGEDEEDLSAELAQLAAIETQASPSSSSSDFSSFDDLETIDVAATQIAASPAPTPPPPTQTGLEAPGTETAEEAAKIGLVARLLGLFRRKPAAPETSLPDAPTLMPEDMDDYHPPWYLRKGAILGLLAGGLVLLGGLSFLLVSLLMGPTKKTAPDEKAAARHGNVAAPASAVAAQPHAASAPHATTADQASYEALLQKNRELEAENQRLKSVSASAPAESGKTVQTVPLMSAGTPDGKQKGMDCQLGGGGSAESLKRCIEQFNQDVSGRK